MQYPLRKEIWTLFICNLRKNNFLSISYGNCFLKRFTCLVTTNSRTISPNWHWVQLTEKNYIRTNKLSKQNFQRITVTKKLLALWLNPVPSVPWCIKIRQAIFKKLQIVDRLGTGSLLKSNFQWMFALLRFLFSFNGIRWERKLTCLPVKCRKCAVCIKMFWLRYLVLYVRQ